MSRFLDVLMLSVLLAAPASYSHAEDSKEQDKAQDTEEETGLVDKASDYVEKATVYIDDTQGRWTEGFSGFMTQVDGFFSDATTNQSALSNNSWARIRLDTKSIEGEGLEVDPSVKIRVALPNTERRLKLLISTEDEDIESVGGNVGGSQIASGSDSQNASAAIRFIRSARSNGNADVDIGVRQREGNVQYFGRLSLGYRTKLKRRWDFSASNSYWHYNKSGFENRLSFDFRRVLYYKEDFFFRSFTEFNWRKGRKGAIAGQTVGIYTQIDENRALALEALASYHTALNEGIDDRFRGQEFRIRWRHNIWRPWFFYELWPSVSWPSENDYERLFSLLFRLEMTIGHR